MLTHVEISSRIAETGKALTQLVGVMHDTLEPATQMILETLNQGGMIFVAGNGGSASHAQHLTAELMVRFETDRRPLAALALTADSAVLTAAANDYGFEWAFSRQIEGLGSVGDTLIVFSTSGKSKNIKEAIHMAHKKGLRVLGISGNKGMVAPCNIDIRIPATSTAIIQEMHQVVIHLLCQSIEKGLPK